MEPSSNLLFEEVGFVGYVFVDDADLCATAKIQDAAYTAVVEAMQESADEWEGGLRATGGAIQPPKSFWWLINFEWNDGEWSYSTVDETPASITMLNDDGEREEITRLEVHEAERTLGFEMAPDGNMNKQFEVLLEKANQWADLVRSGHLP